MIRSIAVMMVTCVVCGCGMIKQGSPAPTTSVAEPPEAMSGNHGNADHSAMMMAPTTMPKMLRAIAVIEPLGNSGVKGIVKFADTPGGLSVVADVQGLTPNTRHGFHIHEFGDDTSADGSSAGGHFDPLGTHHHGAPTSQPTERHAGDMGNLDADASGDAHLELTLEETHIGGSDGILGRSVIIHSRADDFGQPTGNAGGRIACGVIGVAK